MYSLVGSVNDGKYGNKLESINSNDNKHQNNLIYYFGGILHNYLKDFTNNLQVERVKNKMHLVHLCW